MALPLIAAQPGIWLADKLSSFDNAYTVVHYLDLKGKLNVDILKRAIMQGMYEADTLQMSYSEKDGEVNQIPGGALPLPEPEIFDFRGLPDAQASSHQLMADDMNSKVRIDGGTPLIRHVIMHIYDNQWVWYQRYHHIQLDAFSFTALTKRMVDIYTASINGTKTLATQPFESLSKVVKEYETYQNSPKYQKDVVFWKEFCEKLPDAASPSSRPLMDEEPSKKILRDSIFLEKPDLEAIYEAGNSKDLEKAEILLALIAVWLLRLTNRKSMSTGFIFMRRLGSAAISSSGPFINVLPFPISLESDDGTDETLITLAISMAKTLKLMRRHQKYDSEKIVRDSGRNWDDRPLYGPVINFKAFDYHLDFKEIFCTTHHVASGPIRDIELVLYLTNEGIVQVEYLANADRYNFETLAMHLKRIPVLLKQFAADPFYTRCTEAEFILLEEINKIVDINSTQHLIQKKQNLVELLQNQSKITENAVALQDQTVTLTYKEMQQQVYSIAAQLQARGVIPGDIVAVALPRSVLLSLALQAIITAGAAWVPLDPSYPKERLSGMIEDAQPKIIITDLSWSNKPSSSNDERLMILNKLCQTIEEESNFVMPNISEDMIAYVLFTSGSTGRPKGVKISHKAIVNRLLWMQNQYQMGSDDTVLQKTPSSFDVSIWEFFWPLITGAKLVMSPPGAERDPEQLLQLILDYRVTTMHFVPSMLATFLTTNEANKVSRTLRRVFCSGEALPHSLAKKWEEATHVPLFNLYGPTEAAIDVTAYPAYGKELQEITTKTVPIGYPIWNTKIHILDHEFNMLPPGIPGDLYISGVQLAEGYFNRPELTNERFITIKGERMYRSGDIAQWTPGTYALEFMGRSDDQVKIRGQRIELGEIDSVLETLQGVSQAVTHPQVLSENARYQSNETDSRQLVAYIVPTSPEDIDIYSIQNQLQMLLPSYMVPVKYVILETLPLSASGKLDRRALPLPASVTDETSVARAPSAGLEKVIADAFKDLLGCENVNADDDFFSLGGHSLLAVRLAALLRNKLDLPVSIGQIMKTPRISTLAAQLGDESKRETWKNAGFENVLPLRQNNESKNILFCLHPASGFSWQFSVLQRYIDPQWALIGIQSAQPDGVLASSPDLFSVVEAHFQEIIHESPEGPYHLLGYSLGGTLAHALAARLVNSGREVAFLGLLDTWPPETQNWDEKRQKNVVDQAVIDEMYRERQQFVEAQQGAFDNDGISSKLFDTIESNYTSAVRLLATARSHRFEGIATLFVAERTFPQGTDLQQVWKPWVQKLVTHSVDCSHVDIISPATFATLGPQINDLLKEKLN